MVTKQVLACDVRPGWTLFFAGAPFTVGRVTQREGFYTFDHLTVPMKSVRFRGADVVEVMTLEAGDPHTLADLDLVRHEHPRRETLWVPVLRRRDRLKELIAERDLLKAALREVKERVDRIEEAQNKYLTEAVKAGLVEPGKGYLIAGNNVATVHGSPAPGYKLSLTPLAVQG